ncbi:hypothetical protein GO730_11520 [Spirosoma sp. HMF3257]|nr:hypothetical protein [Spirosoma telluris]
MDLVNSRQIFLARHMADCLAMNIFTVEEKEELKDALFLLSNHASVKRKIKLIEQGFGHIYIAKKIHL